MMNSSGSSGVSSLPAPATKRRGRRVVTVAKAEEKAGRRGLGGRGRADEVHDELGDRERVHVREQLREQHLVVLHKVPARPPGTIGPQW